MATNAMLGAREMPRYTCHKQVWALRIAKLDQQEASVVITPNEDGYSPFTVSSEWAERHKPEVGGYYVVYKDGYSSYSPADAFEEGYSRV